MPGRRRARRRGLTRREFLKLGAAGAAAVGTPFIVPSTAWGASERINVASIGVLNMGGGHLGTLLGNGGVQVVAICDVDGKVLDNAMRRAGRAYADRVKKGSFGGTKGCKDYREVMARDDVDAVVIATPDHTHALIAIAALKSGKDVYCEKPMTHNIREGQEMIRAVRRYGRVFQTGNQRRSSPVFRRACELVRNGRIGELRTVHVTLPGNNRPSPMTWEPKDPPPGFDYDKWLGPAPWAPYVKERCHYQFRFILDYSGGQMTNWGAHWLDVAQWGIGADDSGPVEIDGKGEFPKSGLFTTALRHDITYTYANGVRLVCRTGGGGCRFEGTEGWLTERSASNPAVFKSEIGPDEVHLYSTNRGHMGNFLDCVRTRKETSSPVETGHRSVSISHLGNIAMRLGRKLRWDPEKQEFPGDDEADRMLGRAYREPWRF